MSSSTIAEPFKSVLESLALGVSVSDACLQHSADRSNFYKYVRQNPAARLEMDKIKSGRVIKRGRPPETPNIRQEIMDRAVRNILKYIKTDKNGAYSLKAFTELSKARAEDAPVTLSLDEIKALIAEQYVPEDDGTIPPESVKGETEELFETNPDPSD